MNTYSCKVEIGISAAGPLVELYSRKIQEVPDSANGIMIKTPFNVDVTLHLRDLNTCPVYVLQWEQSNDNLKEAGTLAEKIVDFINSILSVGFVTGIIIRYDDLTVVNKYADENICLEGIQLPFQLNDSFEISSEIALKFLNCSEDIADSIQLRNSLYCFYKAKNYFLKYDYSKSMLELWKTVESIVGKTSKSDNLEKRLKGIPGFNCFNELVTLKIRFRNESNIAHSPDAWTPYFDLDKKCNAETVIKYIKVIHKFLNCIFEFFLENGEEGMKNLYRKW